MDAQLYKAITYFIVLIIIGIFKPPNNNKNGNKKNAKQQQKNVVQLGQKKQTAHLKKALNMPKVAVL